MEGVEWLQSLWIVELWQSKVEEKAGGVAFMGNATLAWYSGDDLGCSEDSDSRVSETSF